MIGAHQNCAQNPSLRVRLALHSSRSVLYRRWRGACGGVAPASSEVREFLGALLGGRDPQRLLLVVVEVGGVAGTATLGREGRFDLAMADGDPVGGGEPLVVLHVVHAVLQVAVALGEVDL